MKIPTEPIGSIPRPLQLIEAIAEAGDHADPKLDSLYEEAISDTIRQLEATGSPSSPMASSASITTSGHILCMDCITQRRMASKFHSPVVTRDGCPDSLLRSSVLTGCR
jgi:hypothetical protein